MTKHGQIWEAEAELNLEYFRYFVNAATSDAHVDFENECLQNVLNVSVVRIQINSIHIIYK